MIGLYDLVALGKGDNYQVNLQICKIFQLFTMGNSANYVFNESACTRRVTPPMAKQLRLGQILSTQSIMRVFEDGPKYLSMKAEEFEALENTDLTLPITEYSQPFPVVCFPIPENYSRDRNIKLFGNVRTPKYAIIWHRRDMIVFTVIYAKDFVWSTYMISHYEGHTFEEKFTEVVVGERVDGTEAELHILRQICRACLNGALVFDQVKTQNHTVKAPKGSKLQDSVYFSFDQTVKLYSRAGGDSETLGEDGSPVKPHWRRGHWRQQPHGPHNSLRKRIRIAPVLVRKDKYIGEIKDGEATYAKD